MKDKILLVVIAILLTIGGIGIVNKSKDGDASFRGLSTTDCAVSTVTAVIVGNDLSNTLLSLASNRAWAVIEQPINATNTVSISFDEGASATVGNGIELQEASTTNGRTSVKFGLSTEFPYTGAVTGITNNSSSTLRITQCLYN